MYSSKQNIDYNVSNSDDESVFDIKYKKPKTNPNSNTQKVSNLNTQKVSNPNTQKVSNPNTQKVSNYFCPNYNILRLKFQGKITNNELFKIFNTPFIVCLNFCPCNQ